MNPELRLLSDEATPGPWVAQSPSDGHAGLDWYIDTHYNEDGPEPVWADSYRPSAEDVAFIVAAVNYVRDMLAFRRDTSAPAAADALQEALGG